MEPHGVTRAGAHRRLTEAARSLWQTRPGISMADAFELACLRAPEAARHLSRDMDLRAGRGHIPDRHQSNQQHDALGAQVRAHVRGPDGRTDPAKLKAFAQANGCWLPKYETMSPGSRMAGVLGKLRKRVAEGWAIDFRT